MNASQFIFLSIFLIPLSSVFQQAYSFDNKKNIPVQCITAEIAYGELIDKITILQLKKAKITDQKKLENVLKELDILQNSFKESIEPSKELESLTHELYLINEKLWNIEDAIREKENLKQFDDTFIELARNVYITNDKRCHIKRTINSLLGSERQEEKSYKEYTIQPSK